MMVTGPNPRIHYFYLAPRTWYGRLLAAAAGALLLVLLFFFFTLFLVGFGVLAVVAALYVLLSGRGTGADPVGDAIRVEYFPADPEDPATPLDQQKDSRRP